jgi:hypothetical protein
MHASSHDAAMLAGVSAEPELRTSSLEGLAVIVTVLVAPIALYVGDFARYGRLLYPATNFALAGVLFAKRSPWYPAHCVLVFCFVSLVRRLVDEQAGWDASNPVLLTPYLCASLAGLSFVGYWARRQPRHLGPFLVLALCVAWGTALAILHERFFGALVDALKWSVGPLFAVYLLGNRDRLAQVREVVEPCLIWAGAAMAVYGIAQFIDPPIWDANWMRNVEELGLTSIGQPEPFEVRVFSTMNSPGSLGAVLLAATVIALKRGALTTALAVPLMIVGLALCQYRQMWAATVFAVALVLISSRSAIPQRNLLVLLAAVCVLLSSAAAPRIREAITQRATTLATLKQDESLESRLDQYAAFARLDNLIEGEGLAINGASRRLDKQEPVAFDGGLIEVWRSMGIIMGTVFLATLITLVASLFVGSPVLVNAPLFDRAIALATFAQIPMGAVHVGELGFWAWMFLGMGLASKNDHDR